MCGDLLTMLGEIWKVKNGLCSIPPNITLVNSAINV